MAQVIRVAKSFCGDLDVSSGDRYELSNAGMSAFSNFVVSFRQLTFVKDLRIGYT
jgi:hypothetical protein